jgi:DNA invertase Pin-like site-specific DNA recombinase
MAVSGTGRADGLCTAGDTVVVWKLDRLGGNMFQMQTSKELIERGVTLASTTGGTDSFNAC